MFIDVLQQTGKGLNERLNFYRLFVVVIVVANYIELCMLY